MRFVYMIDIKKKLTTTKNVDPRSKSQVQGEVYNHVNIPVCSLSLTLNVSDRMRFCVVCSRHWYSVSSGPRKRFFNFMQKVKTIQNNIINKK